MKKVYCWLLVCCLLCGCGAPEQTAEENSFAMDTVMNFKVWGKDAQQAIGELKSLITELEAAWSATREDSVLSRLNRAEEVALEAEEAALLQQVEALRIRTGGAFDPQLLSLSKAWGFPGQEYRVPSEAEIAQALALPQWDLGAAVKGYAGQRAAELLAQMDIERAVLNLGGNTQTYGEKADGSPWRIAIQNPAGGDYIGIISVTGTASVVTSGDYQRYFEQDGVTYHHILDPKTGYPAESGLTSVTVICRDGLTADAMSTALFVIGLEAGADLWRQSRDFEAVFITSAGQIYATEGAQLSGCEFEVIAREN